MTRNERLHAMKRQLRRQRLRAGVRAFGPWALLIVGPALVFRALTAPDRLVLLVTFLGFMAWLYCMARAIRGKN
jgi:hypothetical protein